jgi:hypothetical protein
VVIGMKRLNGRVPVEFDGYILDLVFLKMKNTFLVQC